MTRKISSKNNEYLQSAIKTGLSAKAAAVYVCLLEEGKALSPKVIIQRTLLHRQYVYDALEELLDLDLVGKESLGRSSKYFSYSPERISKEIEKKRIDTLTNVSKLMRLYEKPHKGLVQVISGREAVIENDFDYLESLPENTTVDIIGGAGMKFVELYGERIEEYKKVQKEKKLSIRYIGCGEDVTHNKTEKALKNESRTINGIKDIVNVCIWPDNVTFNIYEPEVVTVRVFSDEAVKSQKALFNILWERSEK